MSAPQRVYIPFQNPSDIRLLALRPGKPRDPIECILLSPMNLDSLDTPEETADDSIGLLRTYVALSYVWGDQNDKRLIIVNWQPFWVTYNLFSLLSRVRNLSRSMRCLWVDAICIDQNNQHEREVQVKLMSRIYRQATAIVADVGEESEGKELIPPLLENIIEAGHTCEAIEMSLEGSSYNDPAQIASLSALLNDIVEVAGGELSSFRRRALDEVKSETVPPKLEHHGLLSDQDKSWTAIRRFYASPYWRRIWVLQEFALAPKIAMLYGDLQIRVAELINAMDILSRFGAWPIITYFGSFKDKDEAIRFGNQGFKGFLTLIMERNSIEEQLSEADASGWLITKLESSRHHMSTDPRDKIYALLGLASDGKDYMDGLTYSPDWKYEAVFKNFAKMFIERGHGMSLLYQAGTCSDWLRLPSWVPDWQKVDRSLGPIATPFEHPTFAASSSCDSSIHVRHDEDSLLVRDFIVDKIAKKTYTMGSPDNWSSERHLLEIAGQTAYGLIPVMRFFLSGIKLAQELNGYSTHKASLELALRTLLRGPPSGIPQKQMISMHEGIRAFFSFLQIGPDIHEKNEKEADRKTLLIRAVGDYKKNIGLFGAGATAANQRCFCTTEKGFFGLVPGKVEVGDEVAILNGGNVPFILRRFESGNEQELVYRLVGDGYFHGLMHGEALSLGTYEERDLVII